MTDADLTHSKLGTNLAETALAGAKLVRVNLTRAELPPDITGITFTGTDFTKANLYGVEITSLLRDGVDLTGVDLYGACVHDKTDVPTGWEWFSPSGHIRRVQ